MSTKLWDHERREYYDFDFTRSVMLKAHEARALLTAARSSGTAAPSELEKVVASYERIEEISAAAMEGPCPLCGRALGDEHWLDEHRRGEWIRFVLDGTRIAPAADHPAEYA